MRKKRRRPSSVRRAGRPEALVVAWTAPDPLRPSLRRSGPFFPRVPADPARAHCGHFPIMSIFRKSRPGWRDVRRPAGLGSKFADDASGAWSWGPSFTHPLKSLMPGLEAASDPGDGAEVAAHVSACPHDPEFCTGGAAGKGHPESAVVEQGGETAGVCVHFAHACVH